jgi:hypothetical protein
MIGVSHSLAYLLMSWGAITAVLILLVIHGNTLSSREEDQLYLNNAEQAMMASEQQVLIGRMRHLASRRCLSGDRLGPAAGCQRRAVGVDWAQ